ncbi:hypothetical protein GCM10010446_00020 [Streptomyces enissocaesilis]|uniref:Uncharacterized protein n=1 Tax=Streptomyces enissocaesilis TaxID=332589 RepID=A0ABN3WMU2_9ACTN
MFLISFATIRSNHGREAEPSLKRPSDGYALEEAACTTCFASAPAPRATAALSAIPVRARTSSAYASGPPDRTRAIAAASSMPVRPPPESPPASSPS